MRFPLLLAVRAFLNSFARLPQCEFHEKMDHGLLIQTIYENPVKIEELLSEIQENLFIKAKVFDQL